MKAILSKYRKPLMGLAAIFILVYSSNAYGKNLRESLYKAQRIDIKQKEKYSGYALCLRSDCTE